MIEGFLLCRLPMTVQRPPGGARLPCASTHLSFGPPGFQASHTTLGGLRALPGFLMRMGMCFCISLSLSLRVIDSGHRECTDLSYEFRRPQGLALLPRACSHVLWASRSSGIPISNCLDSGRKPGFPPAHNLYYVSHAAAAAVAVTAVSKLRSTGLGLRAFSGFLVRAPASFRPSGFQASQRCFMRASARHDESRMH